MFPHALRHPSRLGLMTLAVLAACQSDPTTAPRALPSVHFAQGDNGTWTVNSLLDPGNGTCDDTECTLREAVAAATTGARIVFASGLQGTISLADAALIVDNSLSIDGAGQIAVDAQHLTRAFVIAAGDGPVTLSRLTVKNGAAISSGGGISISATEVTLDSLTVTGGIADGANGGGIQVISGSKVTIRNSTIAGNYGLSSYPYYVVLDGQNRVVARNSGELTVEQWEQMIGVARSGAGTVSQGEGQSGTDGSDSDATTTTAAGATETTAAPQ